MIKFLINKLNNNAKFLDASNMEKRDRLGKIAGVVGIVSNLLLFVIKIVIGLISNSIAITADAVNNLSDCASSVITLVGFRLANMPADEEHPYGHARYEYISGLVVSALVLLIGVEFLKSSVKKIIEPTPIEFSITLGLILSVSILVKLWQGEFNMEMGKKIQSDALKATATDSRNDAITTTAVLLASIVAQVTGLNLDGYMGLAVAIFVIWSGIKLIKETLSPLLGNAPDLELVNKIQNKILDYSSVIGLHDLMVHNYGPNRCFASVHVEVPASQDILVSHDIIDNIERDFIEQMHINLVIHLDPIVTDDLRTNAMNEIVKTAVDDYDKDISMHDFRMVEGDSHINLIFDVVVPPLYKPTDIEIRREISSRIKSDQETIYCVITIDRSYTYTTQSIKNA